MVDDSFLTKMICFLLLYLWSEITWGVIRKLGE